MQAPEPRAPSLSPRGLAMLGCISLLLCIGIFLTLAWDVASHAPLVELDARIATWLHEHGSEGLTSFLRAVSLLNSLAGIGLMTMVLLAVLARLREWYWMLSVSLIVPGAMLLNMLLKATYMRARPHFADPWVTLTTWSFPSGHTAAATAFYGVLAAFLVSRTRSRVARVAIVIGAAMAISLVGFSRMYLGAHFFSDVVAAVASSSAWLVACLALVHARVRRRLTPAAA